ncbi:LysM peptidoglycan-binding domain-containing protein [Streptomyces sp. NPDC002004]
MAGKGKHRRPKNSRMSRGFMAVGAGGAAVALPVIAATTASAVPKAAPAVAPSVKVERPALPRAVQMVPMRYSVVTGDSLSKIAGKYALKGGWPRLYRDNRSAVGDNPSLIHPGLKLTVNRQVRAAASDLRADRSRRSTVLPKAAAPRTAPKAAPKVTPRTAPKAAPKVTPKVTPKASPAAAKTYANNLDGWIRESLDIMAKHGIPGSYDGIHRNIMRESSGNPRAINNWDSNAAAGHPSKGLLQVIDSTFTAYHVPGTSMDPFDPVANITAACNYAAARYGSIDNVNGAY